MSVHSRLMSIHLTRHRVAVAHQATFASFIPLSSPTKSSAGRINSIGTAKDTTLEDDLTFAPISRFRDEPKPDYYFTNRASRNNCAAASRRYHCCRIPPVLFRLKCSIPS